MITFIDVTALIDIAAFFIPIGAMIGVIICHWEKLFADINYIRHYYNRYELGFWNFINPLERFVYLVVVFRWLPLSWVLKPRYESERQMSEKANKWLLAVYIFFTTALIMGVFLGELKSK